MMTWGNANAKLYFEHEVPPSYQIPNEHASVQPALAPGDLLLWDSRTAHRVAGPADPQTTRVVCYVCMTPRRFASPQARAL